jgi:ABC-type Na+ transport system ATPase subunit NatA
MYAAPELDRIDEIVNRLGFLPKTRRRALSAAVAQRLHRQGDLHDPEVLLFDEPHTGLSDAAICLTISQGIQGRNCHDFAIYD